MSNNYSVTSITVNAKNGQPAVFGPIGKLLFEESMNGMDSWFDLDSGIGVSDGDADVDTLVESLLGVYGEGIDADGVDSVYAALKAIKNKDDSLVSDAMLEAAEDVATEGAGENLDVDAIIEIVRHEAGADIGEMFFETGSWGDKNRHGEFGGNGYYWSPNVSFGMSSATPRDVGHGLKLAVDANNAWEAARLVVNRFVTPLIDRMPEAMRKQVYLEIEAALAVHNPKEAIITIGGGCFRDIHHNVPCLAVTVNDTDNEVDDDDDGAADIDGKIDTMPYHEQ